MAYQFCCPQGHLLQGELSTVGQIMRCPMCGSDFHVPPPDTGVTMSAGFSQGPGAWSMPDAPTSFSFPVSEQNPAGGYTMPPQAFGAQEFGTSGMTPGMQPPFPMPQYGAPAEASPPPPTPAPKPPAAPSSNPGDRPKFELGFDPFAKASLPFDLPGHSEADATAPPQAPSAFLAGPAAAVPPPASLPPMPSTMGTTPAPQHFHASKTIPATSMPNAAANDFLSGPAVMSDAPAVEAPQPPKMLHIRCPSGHIVKAPSDLLGKLGRCPACKKTFELRYENSLEFKRRTEKILDRDANEANRAWIGWVFVGAFLLFVAVVGAVLIFGK